MMHQVISPEVYTAKKYNLFSQYNTRGTCFWLIYIALIYRSLKQMLGELISLNLILSFLFISSAVTPLQSVLPVF